MWLVIQWFEFNYFIYIIYSKRKYSVTPPMRVFVFSNYRWSLNNWNLLLELGKILKQKWHKTTKNDMLKLTYIKSAMKISTIIASTASHFWALKSYAPKIICFWFQIIQFYFILKDYFFLMCNWVECQWLSDSVCEMHFLNFIVLKTSLLWKSAWGNLKGLVAHDVTVCHKIWPVRDNSK